MKKLIAIFSLFAMFGAAAMAQNPPAKKPHGKSKTVSTRGIKKAVKANVAPAKMNK